MKRLDIIYEKEKKSGLIIMDIQLRLRPRCNILITELVGLTL